MPSAINVAGRGRPSTSGAKSNVVVVGLTTHGFGAQRDDSWAEHKGLISQCTKPALFFASPLGRTMDPMVPDGHGEDSGITIERE